MKKNLATAMAAAMAFGAVVPAFANEMDSRAVVVGPNAINTALAEGKKVSNAAYDEAYDTKFTADKKDDTLKPGVTILDVIKESGRDDRYLISQPFTQQELKDNENLENEIKQAKKDLDDTISEIKHLLTLTYRDGNTNKKLYTLTKNEIQAQSGWTLNEMEVTLTANHSTGTTKVFKFQNIKVDEVEATDVIVKELDVLKAAELKLLSEYVYELDQASSKVTVEKFEVNRTTLDLKVFKKDTKKTHVATIRLHNFDKFDTVEDDFVRISGKNDFTGHWAEKTIFNAMYNNVVDASSKFRPDDSISRAEFVKIVNKAFGLKNKADLETFTDVNSKHWFYNDVLIAIEAGYIDGYEDGSFRPDAKITKQEAAKIVASVIDKKAQLDTLTDLASVPGYNVATDGKVEILTPVGNGKFVHYDSKTTFKDDKNIAPWADESVKVLSHDNIKVLTGYKGNFNPENNITRAEALVMMEKGANLPGVK